jgi:hypothetical protein
MGESDGGGIVTPDERATLKAQIEEKYSWYDRGSRWWSTAHHSSLYLAAGLSGASALLLKLDSLKQWHYATDVAAVASAVAALLGTIAASGGFERKWRANRLSRGKVEELRIDLADDSADAKTMRDRLKAIIVAEDQAVVGSSR